MCFYIYIAFALGSFRMFCVLELVTRILYLHVFLKLELFICILVPCARVKLLCLFAFEVGSTNGEYLWYAWECGLWLAYLSKWLFNHTNPLQLQLFGE